MAARFGVRAARASVLVLLSLVLAITLAGCGSGGEDSGAAPAETVEQAAAPEEAAQAAPEETQEAGGAEGEAPRTATVRLSGTDGMIYAGSYGNLDGSEYAEGVLEGEPVEFTVEMRDSGFDVVNASFAKPNGTIDGTLVVEILSGGEVVAAQEAEAQYGTLNLTWSSDA